MVNFEVLAGDNKQFKTTCTVKMEKEVHKFNHFLTIGREKSGIGVYHNLDIFSLSVALEMVIVAFKDLYATLSDKEKKDLHEFIRKGD